MILPAQIIRLLKPVSPFCERSLANGMSYGLSLAGYDVRIRENRRLQPGEFRLASTLERFAMPDDLLAYVKDKSTWARRGIAVQNTVIEPGWRGYLTLEITNHSDESILIRAGDPIAQIIFHRLEMPTEQAYSGKYQDQPPNPVEAIAEAAND